MIILDIETTGTSPKNHSIVSIGAVDFDNPEIQFLSECRIFEGAHIEKEALMINGFTIDEITDSSKKTEGEAVSQFLQWMDEREDMIVAGQNVFFDVSFVEAAAQRASAVCSLSRRIIDLHSITYFHMIQRDISAPIRNRKTTLDSDKIMEYVGIPAEPKPHKALNGAIWEAEAFSRLIYNKNLFPQFKSHVIPWIKL